MGRKVDTYIASRITSTMAKREGKTTAMAMLLSLLSSVGSVPVVLFVAMPFTCLRLVMLALY
jgi:hypothetical protein